MGRLEGKKALVTGGAQGLGAAIVERLAEEGCDVVIWDVNAGKARETAQAAARKSGRRVEADQVDIADADAVRVQALQSRLLEQVQILGLRNFHVG